MKYLQGTHQEKVADYLYRWIRLSQMGKTIESLFADRGLEKIAIYGFDSIARCLISELKDSSVEVEVIIDKKGEKLNWINFPVVGIGKVSNINVDAIIIMPVADYEVILNDLEKITNITLVTFEELIYEI